jgi:hypothetical protein
MKVRLLCLLLLSACEAQVAYDYSLSWVCLSADGCERTEEVELINRLNVIEPYLVFMSAENELLVDTAQRFGSESLPAGCWWLYGFSLFGHELEPSKVCSTSGGFDLELSIPNRNPETSSEWLVEARALGAL